MNPTKSNNQLSGEQAFLDVYKTLNSFEETNGGIEGKAEKILDGRTFSEKFFELLLGENKTKTKDYLKRSQRF